MKALRTVAMVAGVAALATTGFGAIGGAQLLLGNTVQAAALANTVSSVASVATVVSAGASVGAQLLQKKPGILGGVNQVTIDANAPVPYAAPIRAACCATMSAMAARSGRRRTLICPRS